MKKLYLASSWKNTNYENVKNAIEKLERFYIYDFRKQNTAFDWHWIDANWEKWTNKQFISALDNHYAKDAFNDDFSHLRDCDICVLITPCGKSSHLELGYAAGLGKETYVLLMDDQRPELSYKMASYIVTSLDELLVMLRTA